MNRQIAKLGIALLVCYLALFVQLNNVTIFGAERLRDHPSNVRELRRDFGGPRGTILTADGAVVARSEENPPGSEYEMFRTYPEGDLFAHVVGYWALNHGSTGVERTYNDELAGRTLDLSFRDLGDLFVERDRVGDVTLTLRSDVQQVARDSLGDRRGSVVALDPRTGEIFAMWSNPSYDPNLIANQDFAAAAEAFNAIDSTPGKPLLAKTYRDIFFPGSTFKVVTAAAGIEEGDVTATEPTYPVLDGYVPPQTSRPLRNFGGSSCGGDLLTVLRVSCNTAFAQMAIDVGPEGMIATAEDFGFNEKPPIDLPNAAAARFPTDFDQNLPALAQSGIGQFEVAATPLQMALVAASVANDGVIMTPHVMDNVRDDEGTVVDRYEPGEWRRAVDSGTAALLREAMLGVVNESGGTARGLAIAGYEVGGKTGTAELSTESPSAHAWIIGFAGPPGEDPTVAVAVLVEGTSGVPDENTGGRVAGPIARAVLETVLSAQAAE